MNMSILNLNEFFPDLFPSELSDRLSLKHRLPGMSAMGSLIRETFNLEDEENSFQLTMLQVDSTTQRSQLVFVSSLLHFYKKKFEHRVPEL